jgi:hypothetical protein
MLFGKSGCTLFWILYALAKYFIQFFSLSEYEATSFLLVQLIWIIMLFQLAGGRCPLPDLGRTLRTTTRSGKLSLSSRRDRHCPPGGKKLRRAGALLVQLKFPARPQAGGVLSPARDGSRGSEKWSRVGQDGGGIRAQWWLQRAAS